MDDVATALRRKLDALDTDQAATDILARLQSRCRQELVVRLEDKVKPPLEDLKDRVARRIWMVAQRWNDWKEDEPHLYPTGGGGGTRLYYRKGDTSILMYDQPPTVRTVTFAPGLISENAAEPNRKFFLSLPFPYVVFVFHFVAGKYQSTYVFYLREPLTSVHQRPLYPSLPNIDRSTLKVCHGDFAHNDFKAGDYYGQTRGAVDHFWRSEFNSNWTESFKEAQGLDERLRTPRKWEAAGRQDPLFVLGVPWRESPYPTFRHLFTRLFEADKRVQELNQHLFMDLVTETSTELLALLEGHAEDPEALGTLRTALAGLISDVIAIPA